MKASPKFDASFPGGNIIVQRIDGDTVHVRPDLRDTEGHWFYWNFRVRGAQGRTLRFAFCLPYTLQQWQAFAKGLPASFEQTTLTRTRQNREFPLIQVGVEAGDQGKSFVAWAGEQTNCRLATIIEIPYANAEGASISADSCREFGAALVRTINTYFEFYKSLN